MDDGIGTALSSFLAHRGGPNRRVGVTLRVMLTRGGNITLPRSALGDVARPDEPMADDERPT